MDPLDGVRCGERQHAGQHLVEDHPEGIKIAARVDRPVHPSGLFGRHIGKRSLYEFRGSGGLTLARQS